MPVQCLLQSFQDLFINRPNDIRGNNYMGEYYTIENEIDTRKKIIILFRMVKEKVLPLTSET